MYLISWILSVNAEDKITFKDPKKPIPKIKNEIFNGVGHPDILDDIWANLAKRTDLWGSAQGKTMNFKEWKYDNKNTISSIRKEYRQYVSNKILELVNKKLPNKEVLVIESNTSSFNFESPLN